MERLGLLLGLVLLPLTVTGCGGTCGTFCDFTVACLEEDFDGCNWEDEDVVFDECVSECNEALDKLSGDEASEFDECVACVADEIGSPDECNDGDYADAIFDDCDSECDLDDGFGEFVEEADGFYDDDDIDC